MWNGSGWSVARLEVQTNTGCCIVTSAGGLLPVGLPLQWSRNEACALVGGVHRQPTLSLCEGFECEHTCWDPKDGELCLSRAKPEETLVEARSDTDVQIVRLTWV